jgi:hypothetical protein
VLCLFVFGFGPFWLVLCVVLSFIGLLLVVDIVCSVRFSKLWFVMFSIGLL